MSDKDVDELGVEDFAIIELTDGPGNHPQRFINAVDTLADFVGGCSPVLGHCHAGRSRSVVVVAAYLMRTLKISDSEAIQMIASKREIYISNGVIDMLRWL